MRGWINTRRPALAGLLALTGLAVGCPPGEDDVDADGDGWAVGEDCADGDPAVHPDAEETCATAWDDDCDGDPNDPDALGCVDRFGDADGDGFGDPAERACLCTPAPPWLVDETGDCDDDEAEVHPGGVERTNDRDDDCDGQTDEGVLHDEDVQRVWTDSCMLCHLAGGFGHGLELEDGYAALVGRPALQAPGMMPMEPFSLDDSYLWHKLSGTQEQAGGWGMQMPYDSVLPTLDLELVATWIEGGALP